MRPEQYAEHVLALCLDADPSAALSRLGAPEDRWRLYRDMVRRRIERHLVQGLPETARLLSSQTMHTVTVTLLDERATDAPELHQLAEAAATAVAGWDNARLRATTGHDADAVRLALRRDFARARLLRDARPDPEPLPAQAFHFDDTFALTPLRAFVAAPPLPAHDGPEQEWLLIRSPLDLRVYTREVSGFGAAWIRAWSGRNHTPGEALRQVAYVFPALASEAGLSEIASIAEFLLHHGAVTA